MRDELVDISLSTSQDYDYDEEPAYYIKINKQFTRVTEQDFNNFSGEKIAGTILKFKTLRRYL